MTRHKKELMECTPMLKLANLAEHLEELLHQAQEKQLTYPEFLLACLREEVRNLSLIHISPTSWFTEGPVPERRKVSETGF